MLPDLLPLGPFAVEAGGRLTFRVAGARPCFAFVWRNRRVSAVLASGVVNLSAIVGQMPSTLGGADLREAGFAALRAMPCGLPDTWTLRLTPEHRIEVAAQEAMEWPATAALLIEPLIRFLLTLSPYLDLLEETGLSAEG